MSNSFSFFLLVRFNLKQNVKYLRVSISLYLFVVLVSFILEEEEINGCCERGHKDSLREEDSINIVRCKQIIS